MFCTDSSDTRIIRATTDVGFLFEDQRFIKTIIAQGSFDMTDQLPREIVDALAEIIEVQCIIVSTYRPRYWRSKAHARFQPSKPNMVQLSSRRLSRYSDEDENHASLIGSIVHEVIHLVDAKFKQLSFGHGGNRNQHLKKGTAPCLIGALAKAHILKYY